VRFFLSFHSTLKERKALAEKKEKYISCFADQIAGRRQVAFNLCRRQKLAESLI